MDLFTLAPSGKLNDVDLPFSATRDVTLGPDSLSGALGDIIKCSFVFAQQRKKSGTDLYGGEYQLVRTKSNSTLALVAGGLVAWSDIDNFIVTPDLTDDTPLAGFALNIPTTKGNCVLIQVAGDVDGKFKASATTKATSEINDFGVLSISSGAGTIDVLADATGLTWATAKLAIVRLQEAATAGALSRVSMLPNGFVRAFKEGVR